MAERLGCPSSNSSHQRSLVRVQLDDDLAKHFLELTRNVTKQLLAERIEVDYDPEWPLKDHEYLASPNDPPVGGDLFEILEDYANLEFFNRRDLTKPRCTSSLSAP
jgi:hypothetical protein